MVRDVDSRMWIWWCLDLREDREDKAVAAANIPLAPPPIIPILRHLLRWEEVGDDDDDGDGDCESKLSFNLEFAFFLMRGSDGIKAFDKD